MREIPTKLYTAVEMPPIHREPVQSEDKFSVADSGERGFGWRQRVVVGGAALSMLLAGCVSPASAEEGQAFGANDVTQETDHYEEEPPDGHFHGDDSLEDIDAGSSFSASQVEASVLVSPDVECIEGNELATVKVFYASTEDDFTPENEAKVTESVEKSQALFYELSDRQRALRVACGIGFLMVPDLEWSTIDEHLQSTGQHVPGHRHLVYAAGNNEAGNGGLSQVPEPARARSMDLSFTVVSYFDKSDKWQTSIAVHELLHSFSAIKMRGENTFPCDAKPHPDDETRTMTDNNHSALLADPLFCGGGQEASAGEEFRNLTRTMDAAGNNYFATDETEENADFYDSEYNIATFPFLHQEVEQPPEPELNPADFPDIASNNPFREAIRRYSAEGVIYGHADGTFRPDEFITRDQAVVMLARYQREVDLLHPLSLVRHLTREPLFTDVQRGHWAFQEVGLFSLLRPIFGGARHNEFVPREYFTRGQLATVMYGYAKLYDPDFEPEQSSEQSYSDVSSENGHADAAGWATRAGLFKGFADGTFRPNAPVRRDQFAGVLERAEEEGIR